jgi:MoxR-like ATPase
MAAASNRPVFIGRGQTHSGPWYASEDGDVQTSIAAEGHPARYDADDDLVAAVNTALLLDKPLLLTGSPGTGKSDLAERLAWELQLGPVLRFEAQSLSEANDLFYRYDLIGRMASVYEQKANAERDLTLDKPLPVATTSAPVATVPPLAPTEIVASRRADFVEFGALGKAILRAGVNLEGAETRQRAELERLFLAARQRGASWVAEQGRRSVVLIDEIDKASRDFPNDLLNGLGRMEFRIRELDQLLIKARPRSEGLHPIVIITSNLERDLPGPFLRRCAFHHIADPGRERLARLVRLRVFDDRSQLGESELPPFYRQLLDCFFEFRQTQGASQAHVPGVSELIDIARAMRRMGVADDARWSDALGRLLGAVGAMAKQREDAERMRVFLKGWKAAA